MILGPFQFDSAQWLLLAPALWVVVWLLARRSLAGLSGGLRRTAIGVRAVVILLLCAALAEPSWRSPAEDIALVAIVDRSRSMPAGADALVARFVSEAGASARPGDRLGVVTAARDAYVQSLPSARVRELDVTHIGDADATDLAAAVRLATAVLPDDAGKRLLLVTDGNETAGSLLAAAEAARAAGIPIDVLPVEYDIQREVAVERVVSPPTARLGQTVNVKFILDVTAPEGTTIPGRLTLLVNDQPVDLDPDSAGVSARVELAGGVNTQVIPVVLPTRGPQRLRAVFEPDDDSLDSVAENNSGVAVTFVAGEGRVMVYADDPGTQDALLRALAEADIDAEVRPTPADFASLIDLGAYDAVVLADTQSYGFSLQQQRELAAYVHDTGGGLVVIGGPNSFGAGGWIGSPLADALPLLLDPPQKQQLPRGALALIMHSCEMPEGNYWGQQVGLAAVNALTRLDLVGVLEFNWSSGGVGWAYPLSPAGDKSAVTRALKNLVFGDMPDFNSAMQTALAGLVAAEAGQKHCVVISDGDPSGPGSALVQKFIDAGISISTVAVFPHDNLGGPDTAKMRQIAQATGGNFYFVNNKSMLATLPQIFIKEAQTVLRSLIWEGEPFQPTLANTALIPGDPLRGLGAPPTLSGYVVTAEREGLAITSLKSAQGDPILAQWQHGLGRVVAFTSDSTTRWAAKWVSWGQFKSFWEQQVRWAMRPTGSANVNVVTEQRGDETVVTVEALDAAGDRLNFARMFGRVVRPDLEAEPIDLRMTGPGRYEARFRSKEAGAYILNLRYEGQGEGGERGVVQAAVTRPAGDERRALQSNLPLLRRVAEVTNGTLLSGDARVDLPFRRDGVRMPVATRSIWLVIASAGVGLFLVDVAVRRVRIDLPAIGAFLRRSLSKSARASERQVDALRTARERAREQVSKRSAGGPPPQIASRKFEATPEQRVGAAPIDIIDKPSAPARPAQATPPANEPAGMSRLLKAKKRAQERLGDEPPPN